MADDVPARVGRYSLHGLLGAGGMATVHFGRFEGEEGFMRTVAIKRLHPHLGRDRLLSSRFFAEARLVTRIAHANVVQTLDVVTEGDECILAMEYVSGETLARLLQSAVKRGDVVPPPIVSAIVSGVLHGLHAAHEAKSEKGEPLRIVHRDVSPQNILVGSDGVPRLLDFGIAKAVGQTMLTPGGELRGKVSYMAPEQLEERSVSARTDVFCAAIVLWESLVGRRLFLDAMTSKTVENTLTMTIPPPSAFVPELPAELDAVVLRGLERKPEARYASAREMALALERVVPPASPSTVAAWVEDLAHDALQKRADLLRRVEAREDEPPTYAVTPPHEKRKWSVRALAPFALVALASIAVAFVMSLRTGDEPRVPINDVPAASSIASAAPTASASVVPSSSAAKSDRPPRPRPIAHPPSTTAHCTPPFTTDSAGHRVYKEECF